MVPFSSTLRQDISPSTLPTNHPTSNGNPLVLHMPANKCCKAAEPPVAAQANRANARAKTLRNQESTQKQTPDEITASTSQEADSINAVHAKVLQANSLRETKHGLFGLNFHFRKTKSTRQSISSPNLALCLPKLLSSLPCLLNLLGNSSVLSAPGYDWRILSSPAVVQPCARSILQATTAPPKSEEDCSTS